MVLKKLFSSTLRNRLATWYIGSLLLLFVFLTTIFTIFSWVTLHEQIDHHVHVVALEAANIVSTSQGSVREQALQNLVGAQGMVVLLLTEDGRPLLANSSINFLSLTEQDLLSLINSQRMDPIHPDHFTLKKIRFAIVNLEDGGQPIVLAVGYSLKILEQTFFSMLLVVAISIILLLTVLSWLARKRLRQELSPLETIADLISQIKTPQDLSLQINTTAQSNELLNIVGGVNKLLKQLETVFKSEHDFFSHAAHTLKTPLAVLRAQIETSSLTQKMKRAAIETIDQAAEIVDDLLLISRIETDIRPELAAVQLTKVMNNCIELAQTLGSVKKIRVKTAIEPHIRVKGNLRFLRRAIGNIIHNAVNYADEGGIVSIELKKITDEYCLLIVTNTGKGINSHDLDKIFDRFYRGKNALTQKGSGLGLAITKAVIEKMGGQINVKSEKNLTKLELKLPIMAVDL